MSKSRLSVEDKADIARRFQAGEPTEAICVLYRVDRSYPRIIAARLGMTPAAGVRRQIRPFTDADDALIREVWASSMRDVDVARLLGRTRSAVMRRAREALKLLPRRLARHRARAAG